MSTLAERVKTLRTNLRITQAELGEAVGVRQQTIDKIERGIIKMPRPSVLTEMAKALETTASYLAFDEQKEAA